MAKVVGQIGLVTKTLNYIRDPAVALWRKAAGLGAALYVIWPLDFIPDVPVIGWLDDIGVVSATAMFMIREISRHARRAAEPPPPVE